MKILICMCVLSACVAAQDTAKTTSPPAVKQTKKAPAPLTIPKDAVQTTPGFYRWTDKDGKVWTYRRTPFGVSRWPAESVDAAQSAADKQKAVSERTTAVEAGDSIRFEQSTPFGKRTWVRKKSELNETEQRIWDLQQKNGTASRTAEQE
jgi:hypothetical protein